MTLQGTSCKLKLSLGSGPVEQFCLLTGRQEIGEFLAAATCIVQVYTYVRT